MPVDWRVRRVQDDVTEPDLMDVEVTDAFNRFARQATAKLNDPNGDKKGDYPFGTDVAFEYSKDGGSSWTTRLSGFSVDPQNKDGGFLELDVLSHDFWLRRREIVTTYNSSKISVVLKDLIETFTPLAWNASLVTVTNDESITREWRGERLDAVIEELSDRSDGEEFGANDSKEFFFRPINTDSSPRDFTAGEYTEADFSEDGKQDLNKVTVYYGEDNSTQKTTSSVSVNDYEAQQDLQDKQGTPRPVVIEATRSYPQITTEAAAADKARALLAEGATIQTGEVTTWDALGVDPGDVARVVVSEQGIDKDFRVAELTWSWLDDETRVTLAENAEGVIDVLNSLSTEVRRVDMREAKEDAASVEFLDVDLPVGVKLSLTIEKQTVPDDMFFWGEYKGGWGDPKAGGGKFGDQRGDPSTEVDI